MADGNKRYLGDVFINEENLERQERFLRDIIESYQYELGGTFDATTLQGMSPSDFATKEQGEIAENALFSPLLIGKSPLINTESSQYIHTDAVLLDREDEVLNLISWYTELENDNVTDALKAIYNNVMSIQTSITNQLSSKADKADLDKVEDLLDGVYVTVTDDEGNEVKKFNADLINGFRPCLISSQAYENLPQAAKNNWRNIFIIRDDIPAEYENPLVDLDLSVGYDFRIDNGIFQYTNGLSSEWRNICSLEALLSGANLLDIIKNFIEDNEGYIINEESFLDSLEKLSPNQINLMWGDYPFLSSVLHDDFVYDIKLNGSKDYITDTIDENDFKNVDIDVEQILKDNKVLSNNGDNIIEDILDSLDDQLTSLNNVNTSLSSVQEDVQDLKDANVDLDEINSNITKLQNSINSINTNISTITTKLNNLGTYTKYTGTFINSTSDIFYNDYTKLAYAQVQMSYTHKKAQNGKWVKIGTLPAKFTPVQGFKVAHAPNVTIYFKYDRTIHCRVDKDSDTTFTIGTGGVFYYK